jgi:beta-phosphoglucomutase
MKKFIFNPEGILFDLDGVIVDSMPYHFISWYEALRPFGVRVSVLDIYKREGERWDKTLLDYLATGKIKAAPKLLKKIFSERQKIFNKYFKRYLFKGAPEFLTCLKKRSYQLALVTGTPLFEVEKILPVKIKKFFDVLVTGDQLKNGKPAPDPYLEAARRLKLSPEKCLVIENSPLGITSAKRAGMFCIALTTSLPEEYLRKADLIANQLEEIIPFIDRHCSVN